MYILLVSFKSEMFGNQDFCTYYSGIVAPE